ncbi:uncharacterized protein BYT42DRAFT_417064 [Radiomyces spectabilis]|uniref:uncharacterized protein n=1 Tax=Radiomyces spectabilis TaxID=64574 RepID=UPI00221F639E|nr:uncharacterized protein BYT42DRAFT_417064 [Radiomyces spectabilis]KAI8374723.1 hypothetical protein BYT42DRAFT_417064 [Radiomyces spectabilis]
MSNVKPTVEMVVGQPEESSGNRGPFRRNSRSAQLESPIMAAGDLEEQSVVSSSSPEPNARVTRSQSIESSVEPIETKKRHRKTRGPGNNKRKAETNGKSTSGRDDTDRETRNKTQRISKEAREARKAEREIIIKERLAELDKLEKAVKNESHAEYHKLLRDIEAKRTKKVNATESRHSLAEMNIRSAFIAQKKVAFDQFYVSSSRCFNLQTAVADWLASFFPWFSLFKLIVPFVYSWTS